MAARHETTKASLRIYTAEGRLEQDNFIDIKAEVPNEAEKLGIIEFLFLGWGM